MRDDEFDFERSVSDATQTIRKTMKRVNIVIAGKAGVGKSTLINAVFRGELAATGQGRPVTTNTTEYTKEDVPLSILDTRGLELDKYAKTLEDLDALIRQRRGESDIEKQIHVAWLCISEDSRRVESGETTLAEMFDTHGIPTVAVITKARTDNGFSSKVRELLPSVRNVSRVRALSEEYDDGYRLPQSGLRELIELTVQLIPEAQRNAFAAVQKVNLAVKQARARRFVDAASASAAAAAAVPLPLAQSAVLLPIEVGMLVGIGTAFGLPPKPETYLKVIRSALLGLAGSIAVRAIAGELLKLIPGVGSVIGGALAASSAALVTKTLGEIYIEVLSDLFSAASGGVPSSDDVANAFSRAVDERRGTALTVAMQSPKQ